MLITSSKKISDFCVKKFDANLLGSVDDFVVDHLCARLNLIKGGIAFIKKNQGDVREVYVPRESILIVPRGTCMDVKSKGLLISVDNPRLVFGMVTANFFVLPNTPAVHPTAQIDPSAKIDPSASIGEYSVVGPECVIGAGSILHRHVVLSKKVIIGKNCVIWSNAVLGEDGFGIEYDLDGNSYRLPHVGGVIVGNGVQIGNCSAVASGTIDPTIIGDFTMVDNCVHIAHNVQIGSNCHIKACSEISGSVRIGDRVCVAPNASIIHKVEIGEGSIIGLGAAVIRSVEPYTVVAGVPAKLINKIEEHDYD